MSDTKEDDSVEIVIPSIEQQLENILSEIEEQEEEEKKEKGISLISPQDERKFLLMKIGTMIENNDTESLSIGLNALPITQLTDDEWYELLANLLTVCMTLNRRDCCRLIIDHFVENNIVENQRPLTAEIFNSIAFSEELLAFTIKCRTDVTYVETVMELINFDDDVSLITAFNKVDTVFLKDYDVYAIDPNDYEIYKSLLIKAEEIENTHAYNYLSEKIKQTSPLAPYPEWVNDYKIDLTEEVTIDNVRSIIPEDNKFIIENLNTDKAVRLLIKGLEQYDIEVEQLEEAKSFITEKYVQADTDTKIEMLQPVLLQNRRILLQENDTIFRILGPVNPLAGRRLTDDHHCSIYGGCRMLLCDTLDYDDEDDEYIDYYDGNCDRCRRKIAERHHCLRIPGENGAWKGCYDTLECALESTNSIAEQELLKIVYEELMTIGIQKR